MHRHYRQTCLKLALVLSVLALGMLHVSAAPLPKDEGQASSGSDGPSGAISCRSFFRPTLFKFRAKYCGWGDNQAPPPRPGSGRASTGSSGSGLAHVPAVYVPSNYYAAIYAPDIPYRIFGVPAERSGPNSQDGCVYYREDNNQLDESLWSRTCDDSYWTWWVLTLMYTAIILIPVLLVVFWVFADKARGKCLSWLDGRDQSTDNVNERYQPVDVTAVDSDRAGE